MKDFLLNLEIAADIQDLVVYPTCLTGRQAIFSLIHIVRAYMNRTANVFYWGARIVAALIMFQTLYFKFTGSYESIYIFSTVGMEPWGRIGVGVLELIASALILISATAWLGAGLALGLMIGAIGMHLTLLGIQVRNEDGTFDGGQLFIYALIVTACSLYVLWQNRERIQGFVRRVTR